MAEPWTPGPWMVESHADGEKDELYGTFIWAGPALVPVDEWYGRNAPNPDANARLIALAPEMAELLAKLSRDGEWCDAFSAGHIGGYAADAVADLLARARG